MGARWAAPSWVVPGGIRENAEFLAGKAPAIALCLFETRPCLAYSQDDLPASKSGIDWHIHLPLDLPWDQGAGAVAEICATLCAKADQLEPSLAVLHPPAGPDKQELLREFAVAWRGDPGIALENTAFCDIAELGKDFLLKNNFAFCMDVAHALCYGQIALLASDLPKMASIFHWSAPGANDRHLPLSQLTGPELEVAARIMAKSDPAAIHLLEVFDWAGVKASLGALKNLGGWQ